MEKLSDNESRVRLIPEDVAKFCGAIGEPPSCPSTAPPTYAATLLGNRLFTLLNDLGIDPSQDVVLHVSQNFEYHRPLPINDTIIYRTVIREHRTRPHGDALEVACEVTTEHGRLILTFTSGLVVHRNRRTNEK